MRFLLHSLVVLATVCSSGLYLYAESVGNFDTARFKQMKSENGLVLSWQPVSADDKAMQVEVLDDGGHVIASLNVLRLVPEAERVSIHDVSARPGQIIAVAAVYRKANHHLRPISTLLLFDFSGRLLSTFALEPSREIDRLAVDDKSNVWTITSSSGGKDPSTVPMVIEYTPTGVVSKELLARNMFPTHARETQDSLTIGRSFMGYDSHGLWFWLPGSTELVAISTDDGRFAIVKTQLPKLMGSDHWVPVYIVREPSGRLVAQVRRSGSAEMLSYAWSAAAGWSRFESGKCEGAMLIGASEKGLLYLQYERDLSGQPRVCVLQPQ